MDKDFAVSIYDLCNATNTTSPEVGSISTAMVSSFASAVGSILIIISFAVWPDLRTTGRAILVFLAISDLLTAAGYLFASVLFLSQGREIAPSLCTFQSFLTTSFLTSSFLWTANLAVYLFVAITLKKGRVAKKLFPLFHLIAWGIPLLLATIGASTGVLGVQGEATPFTQGTVAWCWVSFNNTFGNGSSVEEAIERLTILHVLEFVFGKFWEIIVFAVALSLFIAVKVSLRKIVSDLHVV